MALNNAINSSGIPIPINKGGTGQTTQSAGFNALSPMTTVGDVIYGGASGAGTRLAGNTTTTKKFLSGTGDSVNATAPTWAIVTADDAISGQSLTSVTVVANDKVVIQDTSDSNNVKTVTAQSIADLATGGAVTEVTGTTQSIASAGRYIANNAGLITFTLPVSSAVGDTFQIVGKGAGLYEIDYTTNQLIRLGNVASTTTSGAVTATHRYDCCYAMCIVANLEWVIYMSVGNFDLT